MKRSTLLLLLFSGIGQLVYSDDSQPPFHIKKGLFDLQNLKSLGLEPIPSERFEIYRANEKDGIYSHHPGIAVFKGNLYCSWSNGKEGHEDYPKQRVLISRSVDGENWSKPVELARPSDERNACTASGFHQVNSTLVAYYTVRRGAPVSSLNHPFGVLFARATSDGKTWSKPVRVATGSFMEGPRRLNNGRLMLGGETIGDVRTSQGARMRLLYSDDPSGLRNWKPGKIEPSKAKPGPGVFRWTEPGAFLRRDGAVISPFRNTSGYLYASISKDNGATWSVPVKTNFPDSRARFCGGRLPNGKNFIINNPGPGIDRRTGTGNRTLLTIALSDDGIYFDRAWIVRGERAVHRFSGKGKSNGWQYPHALVWKEHLVIVYSVNKEDVGVTRIALKHLK